MVVMDDAAQHIPTMGPALHPRSDHVPRGSQQTQLDSVQIKGGQALGYIRHHLRTTAFEGQLFSDSSLADLYDHTKGVVRKRNKVCCSALLLGVTEQKQVLDETDLRRVTHDLEGQLG